MVQNFGSSFELYTSPRLAELGPFWFGFHHNSKRSKSWSIVFMDLVLDVLDLFFWILDTHELRTTNATAKIKHCWRLPMSACAELKPNWDNWEKIPAESWVSWPNSTNPKIERRLTNLQAQGPGLYFRSQSQPLVSVISTISTSDLISTLDLNFQSKYKQFLFFEDVKKFDVNWWFQ